MANKPITVSEKVARPVRTGVQGGFGLAVVQVIDAFFYDMNEAQYGATVVLATIILGFFQTAGEDKLKVGFLRNPPEGA